MNAHSPYLSFIFSFTIQSLYSCSWLDQPLKWPLLESLISKKRKEKNCWSPPVVGLALNQFDLHEALNAVDHMLKSLLPLYSPVFLARPYIAVNSLQFPFLTLSLPIKCYCFLSSCFLFLPLHPRHFLVPLPDCPSRFTPNNSICPSDRIRVTYVYLPQ